MVYLYFIIKLLVNVEYYISYLIYSLSILIFFYLIMILLFWVSSLTMISYLTKMINLDYFKVHLYFI
jgi:hypothetical protein